MIPKYKILRMEHGLLVKGLGIPCSDFESLIAMADALGYDLIDVGISTALKCLMVFTNEKSGEKWLSEIDTDSQKRYGGSIDGWMNGTDTGTSSMLMATVLSGRNPGLMRRSPPYDPADIGRCFRMLDEFPELKENLNKMRGISDIWDILMNHWDEMEVLYKEEHPTGEAPKLYKLMQDLIYGKET